MLTLLIIMLNYNLEHGPFLLQTFWVLAVVEMIVEGSAIHFISRAFFKSGCTPTCRVRRSFK